MEASENKGVHTKDIDQEELISFLLRSPVFTKQQIKAIKQARKEINRWRRTGKDNKI